MAISPAFLAALSANANSPKAAGLKAGHSNANTAALMKALLNSGLTNNVPTPQNADPNQGSPSVLSRILDVFSRPLYATADAAMEAEDALANHESFWDQIKGLGTGAVHGLSGTQKHTWADVIQQGHDINAQKKATGDSAGYQLGQGGNALASTGNKLSAIGLNIFADPSLTLNPAKTVRAFGEGSQLFKLPTVGSITARAIGKKPLVTEGELANAATASNAPAATQAVNAAASEAGPPAAKAAANLLNINPKALASAKSIPDVLHAKIGAPVIVAAEHPHLAIDTQALLNGKLKAHSLTDVGLQAAKDQHRANLTAFNAAAPEAIKAAMQQGIPHLKATHDYLKSAPLEKDAATQIANKALGEMAPSLQSAVTHNKEWIAKAVANGIDPERAVRVVKDINAGAPFKDVFADAVRNSKVFAGARIGKAGDLTAKGSAAIAPAFKLSSILAPTAQEVLHAIHPTNAAASANIAGLDAARKANSVRRVAALASPLSAKDAAIKDAAVQKAVDAILGQGGRKPMGALNDIVQANLWDNIRHPVASATLGGAANVRGINSRTFKIAAHAERDLEALGYHGVSGNGTPTRLTEAVANSSGYPDKLGHLTTVIINNHANGSLVGAGAKAETLVREGTAAKAGASAGILAINKILADPALSDPLKHLASQKTAKGVYDSIVMNTGSTRAAKAGKALYKSILEHNQSATHESVLLAGNALADMVRSGKIPANYNEIVSNLGKAISESLSEPGSIVPRPSVLGLLVGPQAAAEVGILGRLATWYGQDITRPMILKQSNAARSSAALWGHQITQVFKGLTPAQRVEALRVAQGVTLGANPAVLRSADGIKVMMQNLFSSSELSEAARLGSTSAMRSGLTINEINKALSRAGSDFKFTNAAKAKNMLGEFENIHGVPHDYSAGTDWLNSWEVHNFKGDPVQSLARINTAVFNAMAQKAFFQDVIDRFGTVVPDAGRNIQLKSFAPLKGHYFAPEIVQQLTRTIRDLMEPAARTSPLMRTMDSIMRMWKTQVTIYLPSHSIRNMMGDIYNSWMAGVNGARPYIKAIQVMKSTAGDYKNFEKLAPLMGREDLAGNFAKMGQVPGTKILVTTKDGQKLTAEQIRMAAFNQGLLMAASDIEDLKLGNLPSIKPFGGKVHDFAHGAVQGADHFTRLAHFIHEVQNGRGPLGEIFNSAGRQVRKFHPDGTDLTTFERNTLRRIIPFYSWSRKAVPFVIEGMLTKPGKFMVYPKAMGTLNFAPGNGVNPGQEFPTDQMFPSWLADNTIGPVGSPGGALNSLLGGPSGYVTASPSNPPIDLLQSYGNHPNEGILGGLNPLIKNPIELMSGKHLDTGIPITDPLQYAGESVPAISLFQRLSNVGAGGVTTKGQQQGIGNRQNFINFLTGLKLTNTGSYIKQAQYEQHLKQTAAKKDNRNYLQNFIQSVKQN